MRAPDPTTIKSASLNQLVIHLTKHEYNPNDLDVFLFTFHSFTSSPILLRKLVQRFYVPKNLYQSEVEWNVNSHLIQVQVINFICRWISLCFYDFNSNLLMQLKKFIGGLPTDPPTFANTLSHALRVKMLPPRKSIVQPPEPKVPPGVTLSLSIFDVDSEEIARQMTLIDFEYYSAIKYAEFFNQAWNKPMSHHRAPNIVHLLKRFNDVATWVTCSILRAIEIQERVCVMAKFISIAEELLKMNNFNSFKQVMAGLTSVPINRLHLTKENLTTESLEVFKKLQTLAADTQGNKTLRELQKSAVPPGILYLDQLLTELTFIEDGGCDFDGKLVRFTKCRILYDVIRPIVPFQRVPFNFFHVHRISSLLQHWGKQPTEKEQYEMSLQREPGA